MELNKVLNNSEEVKMKINRVIKQIKLLAPIFNDFTDDEIVLLSVMDIWQYLFKENIGRKKDLC